MGREWRTMLVRDLIADGSLAINDGYRVTNRELGQVGIPFVRGGDIGDDGSICTKVDDHILPDFHDQVQTKLTRPGDVAFISKGTVGRVGFLRDGQPPVVLSPQVCFWRAIDNDCIDSRFLYYLLKSDAFQANLDAVKTHGSMAADYVSLSDQRLFRLSLPPIAEQRGIARVLGSLDDKIDLNRRMNETLEAMARAMFRSWFVDFDPVRAKVDGRKPDGLDAATVKLFPDKFVDSALGPVPRGWQAVSLGDHVEVAKGLSYKGEGLAEAGVALHNLNSVYEGGGYKHEGIKHYVGEYRPCHVIRAGDVIVTNTEQGHDHLLIGYSALIPKRYGDLGLFSHHTYRVRPLPESPLTPPFIHHLLLTSRFRGEVIGFTNGTTVNMLPAEGLKRPRLVLPPAELIQRFTDFVTPLIDKAEANYEESRSLTVTRDALLPKLLSGEVRVA